MSVNFSKEVPLGSGQPFDLAECVTPQVLGQMTGRRHDAADTAIFLRQLTDIFTQTYDVKYPDLKARQFIPVDGRVGPGADSFIWRQFDRRGQAKVVHNYADDFPNVELQGKEFQHRVYSMGVSYQYSLQDMRAASMAGLPLEARKAEGARRAMEELIEHIAAFGCDGSAGTPPLETGDALPMYGFTNNPNILAGGSAGYTTNNWLTTATVTQIMADVNALAKTIVDNSKGVHKPDTMLLPLALYTKLATTQRSPTFTDDTMLQFILKSSPWLKSIDYWNQLDTAGKLQDTTTVGGRIMMYERTPENLGLVIPQEFEQLPPQMIGMAFKIPCHMRIGGVTVRYPKSVAFLDGAGG